MTEVLDMMSRGKRFGAILGIIILVIILAVVAYYVNPAPVETFTPDGTHLADFQIGSTYYNAFQLIFGPDVDKSWVDTGGIVQYLLFPFISIVILMYAIFDEIRFFRFGWFSPAMAVILSLVVSSSGILVRMMRGYLLIAGGLAIVLFGFILVLGIVLWWIGKSSSMSGSMARVFKGVGREQSKRIRASATLQHAYSIMNAYKNSGNPSSIAKAGKLQTKITALEIALDSGQDFEGKLSDLSNTLENMS